MLAILAFFTGGTESGRTEPEATKAEAGREEREAIEETEAEAGRRAGEGREATEETGEEQGDGVSRSSGNNLLVPYEYRYDG